MRDAGSLLVRAGLINDDALAEARTNRARQGGTLAEHLVLAGAVGDEELTQFYRERLMVPRVGEDRLRRLSKSIVSRIPRELAAELRVVPVALDSESSLTIAMSDPSDTHALDELEFFTDHYVVRAVASQAQIAWCLNEYYQISTPSFERSAEHPAQEIGLDEARFDKAATDQRNVSSLDAEGAAGAAGKQTRSVRSRPATSRGPESFEEADALDAALDVPAVTAEATLADLDEVTTSLFERANQTDTLRAENLEFEHKLLIEEDEAIEISAEVTTASEAQVVQTLEDGSPIELAPRVGEVVVNQHSHHQVGGGPAIILDDSVYSEVSTVEAEFETNWDVDLEGVGDDEVVSSAREISGDYDDLVISKPADDRAQTHDDDDDEDGDEDEDEDANKFGAAVDPEKFGANLEVVLEADAPDESETNPSSGVIIEVVERGTDSAPFLLSDIKAAADRLEKEAAAKAKKDADNELANDEAVVLLSVTKRPRRATEVGVGVPRDRAARALGLKTSSAPLSGTLEAVARAHLERTSGLDDGDGTAGPPTITHDTDVSSELAALDVDGSDFRSKRPSPGGSRLGSKPADAIVPVLSAADAAAARELESSFDQRLTAPGLESPESDRMLDALEALASASHRDQIVTAVLDYLDHYCDRVVFLALRSGALEPWQVRTARAPINVPPGTRLPLRENSLLRDIVDTRLPYRGPMVDQHSARLLNAVFGNLGSDGLAVPVAVRGRVVGLLYGDGISTSLSGDSVGLVTRAAGRALERTLVAGT